MNLLHEMAVRLEYPNAETKIQQRLPTLLTSEGEPVQWTTTSPSWKIFQILLVGFQWKEVNAMLRLSVIIKVTLTKYYALHLRLWLFIINIHTHTDMILNNTYEYDFEKTTAFVFSLIKS
jgi:hypothetical protein